MLKLFISREPPDKPGISDDKEDLNDTNPVTFHDIEEDDKIDENGISAAVMGLVECSEEETDDEPPCKDETSKMELCNTDQTETWKDIQNNPNFEWKG